MSNPLNELGGFSNAPSYSGWVLENAYTYDRADDIVLATVITLVGVTALSVFDAAVEGATAGASLLGLVQRPWKLHAGKSLKHIAGGVVVFVFGMTGTYIPILLLQKMNLKELTRNIDSFEEREAARKQAIREAARIAEAEEQRRREEIQRKSKAAIPIQKLWRKVLPKFHARRLEKQSLSVQQNWEANLYVNHAAHRGDLNMASYGKTAVYIADGVVIKECGEKQAKFRLGKTLDAAAIAERRKYQHVVVPKIRMDGEFVIEEKLPIVAGTIKQMALYRENRQKFTAAIKEFTDLLCRSTYTDIAGRTSDPYGDFSKTPIGRYDNIPLYLEQGQGKIGLVDLEHFSLSVNRHRDHIYHRCLDAIRLFPYHLDEILEVASAYDPDIKRRRDLLEAEATGARERFEILYDKHLDFFTKHEITKKTPAKIVSVNDARKPAIISAVKNAIDDCYAGRSPYNLIRPHNNSISQDEIKVRVEEKIGEILELVARCIRKGIKSKIDEEGGYQSILTPVSLLAVRSFGFYLDSESDLYVGIRRILGMEGYWYVMDLAILRAVFLELQKGGEIAYYKPCIYGSSYSDMILC